MAPTLPDYINITLAQCAPLPGVDIPRCVTTVIFFAALIALAIAVIHVIAHMAFMHALMALFAGVFTAAKLTTDSANTTGSADIGQDDNGDRDDNGGNGGNGGNNHHSRRRSGKKARTDIVKDLRAHPRTKSEQQVIDIFESLTGEKFPTVSPSWLVYEGKQLELDGFNSDKGIAIEFAGPLHTKWFPNREPYAKFLERVKRDEAKIRICRDNGVRLFVIDMRIPRHHLYTYVRSRLYDAGLGIKPTNYQPEQIYKPDIDYTVSARAKQRKSDE